MALEEIVNVTITLETAQVARANFGIPLIAAYHTHWSDRVRTYSASSMLQTLVTEGFATTDVTYLKAAKLLSANPRVKTIKVGRRGGAWQQLTDVTPVVANSAVYSVKVNGALATFTSDSSATAAEITTGLAAALDALPLVSAVAVGGTKVTVTTTATGTQAEFTEATSNLALASTGTNATVVEDLTAIRAADANWYALILDSDLTAEIMLAAGWAETQKIVFGARSQDSDATTTGIAADLSAADYSRTFLLFHDQIGAEARWIGEVLVTDPGAATWAFKSLSGVTPSNYSENTIAALKTDNANYYVSVGGANITLNGVMASGEFIDVIIFADWIIARVTERVFTLLVNSPKLAYSDTSGNLMGAEIMAVLQQGVQVGGLDAGDGKPESDGGIPAPSVFVPRVADQDPADRAARFFPGITFSGRLAGAIHAVEISGKLSV